MEDEPGGHEHDPPSGQPVECPDGHACRRPTLVRMAPATQRPSISSTGPRARPPMATRVATGPSTTTTGPGARSPKRRSSPYEAPSTNRSATGAEKAATTTTIAMSSPGAVEMAPPPAGALQTATMATAGAPSLSAVSVTGSGIRVVVRPMAQSAQRATDATERGPVETSCRASATAGPSATGSTSHAPRRLVTTASSLRRPGIRSRPPSCREAREVRATTSGYGPLHPPTGRRFRASVDPEGESGHR